MGVFLRFWAIFVVAAKRLLSQRWLALATALGLIISVALTMSVPLYADAVYYRVLRENLVRDTAHPPFAFMFRYVGAWATPVQLEEIQQVDEYVSRVAGPALGLPLKTYVRFLETDNFQLFPLEDISYAGTIDPLAWVSLGSASDMESHIVVTEGSFPAVADPAPDSTGDVEVMISEALATELGLQVGETYMLFDRRATEGGGERTLQIPVRITGVWKAADPEEDYWFYNPDALDDTLIVPEDTFTGRVSSYLDDEVNLALWYLVTDGTDVHASDAGALLVRINSVRLRAAALLPGTELAVSPADELAGYQRAAVLLTFLLYAFSVPIVGLILAFIGLVVGLSVDRQRGEVAVLRSRGATAMQVVGIALLEGLLVGALALAIGSPIGGEIARIIGNARSFLDFSLGADLRVAVTLASLRYGLAAIGLALIAQVIPTIGAARHTIVTYRQDRARSLKPPWWQRAWLDVMLLIPAVYGMYLLRRQGSIALPGASGTSVADPFQNPLLFLVPALGIFAITLFILRILPVVISAVAWIASRFRGGVGVLLAARHLARTPGFYAAPLVLLVLTLSLSAYTASLAQTLDHHLYDQTYYQVGADVRMVETGEDTQAGASMAQAFGAPASTSTEEEGARWLFLPVSEHLGVPGVRAAARIGRFNARSQLGGGSQEGVFFGIDRLDFTQVAFWREDFAPQSLGALMNALAVEPNGVLVPSGFMGLNVGDTFRLTVNTFGQSNELDMKVVGFFNLFPTWYREEDGELFVGNLDYLFEQAGGEFPYDVWLKTDANVDYEQVIEGVRDLGLNVVAWNAPLINVANEQHRPERQGLFGLLSVGFMAAALLTVLGFLLYAFFSFRRRFIELGILRAIGLSSGQMTAFLAWELAFLILSGAIVGAGLGIWVSNLFIPYLQVGSGAAAQTPPYVVQIAWSAILRICALFGLLFVAALGGLAALLLRMKIFQAVKLGETV
jgi:putative ABC transport system permease protein